MVIMDKLDYVSKFHQMIVEDINYGVATPTKDTTLKNLKLFQNFLYRNFKNNKHYEKMWTVSNCPVTMYGTKQEFEH